MYIVAFGELEGEYYHDLIHTPRSLDYHRRGRPGKNPGFANQTARQPTPPLAAYSPGVAEAVLEIDRDPLTVFEMTARANLVAVISNGSAILGLATAARWPLNRSWKARACSSRNSPMSMSLISKSPRRAPTKSSTSAKRWRPLRRHQPRRHQSARCFEIEERLIEELDIPVFHDDQHGTAIISGAALLNALEVTGKRMEAVKVVINGAGASAIATGKFFKSLGVARENILMLDSRGVHPSSARRRHEYPQDRIRHPHPARTLHDALQGADVLVGLSIAGSVTQEMIMGMAPNPMLFVLANPTPEIMPELALEVRPDAIIGTGRSDYVNQVNNVLGFPFIFRGALDVYPTGINEEMKMAAARALPPWRTKTCPIASRLAYGQESIKFGKDYLIPKPLDPRVLLWWRRPSPKPPWSLESPAAKSTSRNTGGNSSAARAAAAKCAKTSSTAPAPARSRRIVFPEGEEPKIIRAAMQVRDEGIGEPILLGRPERIRGTIDNLGLNYDPNCFDHYAADNQYDYRDYLYELRRRKGVTLGKARSLVRQRNYYASLMVRTGDADAMVSGLTYEYPMSSVRPCKSSARAQTPPAPPAST